MLKTLAPLLLVVFAVSGARGRADQVATPLADLKTTAEASGFTSTSRYSDVMTFLQAVAAAAPQLMHLTTMGTTVEGRAMPLMVVGTNLKDTTPASVRESGKLRVWIQADIHGGEVDGKESAEMLLRDLAIGKHSEWLSSVILLVNPIFNADGNERVALDNRSVQNGPVNGMGQRANAQGFDLNRDHIKLESPEVSAFVKLLVDYDPQVSIDLHTTDGVCSAYYLTYAPPLNPNTSDRILNLLKTDWFPFITKNVKSKHAMDTYYYGNVEGGDSGCGNTPGEGRVAPAAGRRGAVPAPSAAGRGRQTTTPQPDAPSWTTFEAVPRFNNNYVGLRNRFALLGESYAYATFEDRIKATNAFLEEALTFVYGAGARIKKACSDADAEVTVGTSQATSARLATGAKVEILMGAVEVEPNPNNGAPMRRRTDVVTPVQMYDRTSFEAATSEVAAAEYYVPAGLTGAIELLKKHGIQLRQLAQPTRGVEEFVINANDAGEIFQGHTLRRLKGTWQTAAPTVTVPAGAWVVRMNQPLSRLAFYLLEPASDDGLATWNVLDDALKDAKTFPILRKR